MSIESEHDLEKLLAIGRIVGMTIKTMGESLRPGITTAELDAIGAAYLKAQGARSAPQLVYNFPSATCISINDEAAHGIAGDRIVRAGDLVNIDVSAELDGYFADSGASFPVEPIAPEWLRLCEFARSALRRALEAARAGQPLNAIGRAVEKEAARGGYRVVRDLGGHGVGRHIHEKPSVPNYYTKRASQRLEEGLVITIEPFLSPKADRVITDDDGWTLRTPNGSRVAQFEHTIVITRGEPVLVTAV